MTHGPALVEAVARAMNTKDRRSDTWGAEDERAKASWEMSAIAALAAIAAAGRLVPDGWVAVPREATEAMEAAAITRHAGPFRVETLYQSIYRAMVASASVEGKPDA